MKASPWVVAIDIERMMVWFNKTCGDYTLVRKSGCMSGPRSGSASEVATVYDYKKKCTSRTRLTPRPTPGDSAAQPYASLRWTPVLCLGCDASVLDWALPDGSVQSGALESKFC